VIGAWPPGLPARRRRRPALAGVVAAGHLAVAWAVVGAGVVRAPAAVPPDRSATPSSFVVMMTLRPPEETSRIPVPSEAQPPRSTLPVPHPSPPSWAALPVPQVVVAPVIEQAAADVSAIEPRRPPALTADAPAPRPLQHASNGPETTVASASTGMQDMAVPAATPPARPEPPSRWTAARHAHCAAAVHPAALRERGIEGRVHLRVKVGPDGRAQDVQVQTGSGWRLFDDAAQAQARGCRFIPAMQEGRPVESWVEYPVRFTLSLGPQALLRRAGQNAA